MKAFITVWILTIANICSAQIDHWESVVLEGDEFKYILPSNSITDWYTSDFDDSSWSIGNSGFGYGDGDDATQIETTLSVYLRHTFEISDVSDIESLILDMDFDDGFIAYINGVEVARYLLSGDKPSFDQAAEGLHEANLYQGIDPERFELDKSLLVSGTNLLAIAIHNESTTSSDMTGIPFLSLGIISTNRDYRSTPDWFDVPFTLDFVSSNLPIVIIETDNSITIPAEPKINATMWILNNETGDRNIVSNQNNSDFQNFEGRVKIEIRGSSSQALPKKQYGFTTYDDVGEKSNVSLLDMPKENDWILNGLAFDPSLIRDYLTYNLYRQMGNYTTRTEFCEVMINGEYQGLYVLQEKLKADDNRIDINKIEIDENQLPQLTGGYITKADKTNGDPVAWSMDNYGGWQTEFIHEHPNPNEATSQQADYIESIFRSLEAVSRNNDASIKSGFPSVIDMPSFIDYMLISELSSNPDAYQFSTYFHKDRNGKLRAGPIWDCNLTYGNDLFEFGFDRSKTNLWQFFDGNMGAKFWKDLFDNSLFRCYLAKRWSELTLGNGVFSQASIESYIDEAAENISESIEREEAKWGRVGDHAENISQLKNFLIARTEWMDNELSDFSACSNTTIPNLKITAINYHPESTDDFDDSDLEFLRISNTGTESIDLTGIYFGGTGFVYQFPNDASLGAGRDVYLANESDVFKTVYGFDPYDEFSRSMDNSGQSLSMLDAYGNLIDEVIYNDKNPWPEEADGNGSFLELIDYRSDNDLPENWRASEKISNPPLSISESMEPILTIYPNSFDAEINVVSQNSMEEILIYSVDGKQVFAYYERTNQLQIDLGKLEKGVYFLHVKMDHGILTRKIIKE